MSRLMNHRISDGIVSPCGLAIISYLFFLFSCVIPPTFYRHYMAERDWMFLDPPTILFYTLCMAGFIAGVFLMNWMMGRTPVINRDLEARIPIAWLLCIPMVVGVILIALEIRSMMSSNPSILLMLMAQQGDILKADNGQDTANRLMMAPVILSGVIWWAYWRRDELRVHGWARRIVNSTLVLAVLAVMLSSLMSLSRIRFMLVLAGLAVLYLMRKASKGKLTKRFLFVSGICVAGALFGAFIAFSALRGYSDWQTQSFMVLGYSVGSYNRLACLLNGEMRYPFGGHGVYLSSFVAYSTFLNKVIPFAQILHWPGYYELWASEFGAVTQAGLNGSMIWSGAFGYIFADLGWFSPFYVFMYGMAYAVAWRWLKQGRAAGIVVYPYMAFCILLWNATNAFTDSLLVILAAVALLLACYELLFTRHVRALASSLRS